MLIRADARSLPLADKSVQCCITSPPYFGLRDYGVCGQIGLESTPDAYVAQLVAVFREVKRVLKDDGVLWLNLGDSFNAAGRIGHGTSIGLKQRTNRASAAGEDHPRPTDETLKPKDLLGIPWMVAFALRSDGWYLRSDIIWHKPNPMPESVTDRPTKSHEYLFLMAKRQSYYYDAAAIVEAASGLSGGGYSLATHDARKATISGGEPGPRIDASTRNRRSVWTIPTAPYPGAHFATFPEALIEPCVLAGSRFGDVVLDPFGGTATVVRVARRFGRYGVACELNPTYLALAKARIEVTGGLPLEATA